MARLMFVSEGERNEERGGETLELTKTTNNDDNDGGGDKVDGGHVENIGHHRQSTASSSSNDHTASTTTSTTMSNIKCDSTVARLASKFDANGATLPVLRMSRRGFVTTTDEMTTNVRNSSVLETIKFFEKDGGDTTTKKQRCSSATRAETSKSNRRSGDDNFLLVKSRLKRIDVAGAVKPSVQPKPTIIAVGKKCKTVETVENSHYHAPKLLTRKDNNNAIEYQLFVSNNKNKRLSIAKDFSLESVLNDGVDEDATQKRGTKNESSECITAAEIVEKTANASFLHKYLQQCIKSNKTVAEAAGSLTDDSCDIYSDVNEYESTSSLSNKSSLHDRLFVKLKNDDNDDDANGVYEDVPYSMDENTNEIDHHQYADIKTGNNVYDDVIYAQLYNNDEEETENYETISSEVYENRPKELPTTVTAIRSSDSDSSLEQTNSLYELKPNSNFSSATASTFSSSNDCINIKIESPYMFVDDGGGGEKSSSSDVSGDANTDNWDSDENENRQEIIVYTKRSSLSRLRKLKLKFMLNSKDNVEPAPEMSSCCMDDLCDDFDDSSSDLEESEINDHVETVNQLNKSQSVHNSQTQNIYGLVEKARKTVRKSWTSLNQIKMSVVNLSNNFPLKSQDDISSHRSKSVSVEEISGKNSHSTVNNGGSARWISFKSKFRPRYSTMNSSSSIFYLNPEDLRFARGGDATLRNKNNTNTNNNRRRRMTCIELRPARPTSPPPPPPSDKARPKSIGTSHSNIYSDRSSSSYESRNSLNGTEATFDLNSSRSSDLHLRFADEPLYQFYAQSVAKLTTSASMDCLTDSDGYEEIASNTSRPSAMELITPSPTGHGQYRSLWCEVDEVKNSGILETLSLSKQRLQEAVFEIITSEASYYKSLSVLDKIFVGNPRLKDEFVLKKNDWKILFGNVAAVRKCSEKLLAALEKCWQDSILLTGLCDVIYQHANENFKIYVKYCSNQIYIDRTLKSLKEQNSRFVEIVSQLEANPMCQSLSLHSFLMLPMQRITRMPLLLDAVLSRMSPMADAAEYKTYQITLAMINKIVKECNETARKLERYEEMLLLSGQLEFSKKDVKMFSVASSSRWLIRSGPMVHINPQDIKLTLTRKFTKQTTKFYFFLFNDILVVAKKKSEDTYVVFDYCARNMLQMSLPEDDNISPYKYLLLLTMLENHEGKTVEMILSCDSDSTRQRWIEATSSHLTSDNPEEKLYEEWDCPQVSAIHAYTAVQPDELSLQVGDVVKVLKKTSDGWCHGERIRDGVTGWFPGNYMIEIASQHMRAKNLKLRHRLLILSGNYLQFQLQKKT